MELIQSPAEFSDLKEDWNELLSSSASHVPFLRHEYLASWWSTLGGGEWDQGELSILIEHKGDGTLGAIAPFFVHEQRVMFLGSFEISDYLDFIAPAQQLAEFIPAVISDLQSDHFPDWHTLDLFNLREDSPTLPILLEEARQQGFEVSKEIIQPAPYLHLPGSWQEYLEGLKDRYRREIEKKIHHADDYFLPVSWYIVSEEHTLEEEMDAFLNLMSNHPQKKVFLTEKMAQQMKTLARKGFQEGWLQLAFLQVGEIKAAGYLNFDFNDQIWVYNSGIDPLFENLSPGWVLLGKIIHWAIDQQRIGLDFMRGDEAYKYQFGGIEKQVLRVRIQK